MHRDGLDLLRVFNAHDVRYLVVGAHAVGYWAEPRATGDLDIWTEPSADNAPRAWAALVEFGAPLAGLTVEDLGHARGHLPDGSTTLPHRRHHGAERD